MDVPIVIGLTKESQYAGTSVIGQFITNEKYGILFKKGNPLVSCVNQVLAQIKADVIAHGDAGEVVPRDRPRFPPSRARVTRRGHPRIMRAR